MNDEVFIGATLGSLTELTAIEEVALATSCGVLSVPLADEVCSTVADGLATGMVVGATVVVEEPSCPAGVSSNGAEVAGPARANTRNKVTVVNFIFVVL